MKTLIFVLSTLSILGLSSVHAATSVILNTSPAFECYQEVMRYGSVPDFDSCDTAIELQPLDRLELAATYSNRGILYSRKGRIRAALSDHNRAVDLAPELSSTFINRANTYVKARRFVEAMSDMDRAVAIADDRLAVAHYNRALLFQRIGDLASARKDGELAASLSPDDVEYQDYVRTLQIVQMPQGKEIAPDSDEPEHMETRKQSPEPGK
jgi:tetratricopeptide (TPR) repeat protein